MSTPPEPHDASAARRGTGGSDPGAGGTSAVTECLNCGAKNRVPAVASGVPQCSRCHEALPWSAVAGDDTFADVVEGSSLPVLLDLWAPWCGPCRTVSPALEQLARERAGQVKLVKVDVDQARRVAARFAVQGIPTLLVLHDGKVVARQTGAAPIEALRTWLDQALGARSTVTDPSR